MSALPPKADIEISPNLTGFNLQIATDRPPQLLKSLLEVRGRPREVRV